MKTAADVFMNAETPMLFLSRESMIFNYMGLDGILQVSHQFREPNMVLMMINTNQKMIAAMPCEGDTRFCVPCATPDTFPSFIHCDYFFDEMVRRKMLKSGYSYVIPGHWVPTRVAQGIEHDAYSVNNAGDNNSFNSVRSLNGTDSGNVVHALELALMLDPEAAAKIEDDTGGAGKFIHDVQANIEKTRQEIRLQRMREQRSAEFDLSDYSVVPRSAFSRRRPG